MYAYLKGEITELNSTAVIIEINNIGYTLNISLNTFEALKDKKNVQIYTWLQVKEDGHTFYGFYQQEEKEIFLKLITVSGIGANTARLLLSHMTPIELANVIFSGDVKTLKSVKGIGQKGAQRIVVDLQDKVQNLIEAEESSTPTIHSQVKEEAIAAFIALGYPKNTALKAVEKTLKENDPNLSVEETIKLALKLV